MYKEPTANSEFQFKNVVWLTETTVLLDQTINRSINTVKNYCEVLLTAFSTFPLASVIELPQHTNSAIHQEAIAQGIVTPAENINHVKCKKAAFFQHPYTGLVPSHIPHWPLEYTVTNGIGHPVREPNRPGIIYKRYIKAVNKTLSFQSLSLENHLNIFHSWMNQPRVSKFWELSGDLAFHEDYITKITGDKHTHPVIAYFDDIPFGYFEIYWAKEDRISAYYDAHDHDRGLHVLVGNREFLGRKFLSIWMLGLMQYTFISAPLCQRLVGEPRIDNSTFISTLQNLGWVKLKEFDFPHKRAAFLSARRELFFTIFGSPETL